MRAAHRLRHGSRVVGHALSIRYLIDAADGHVPAARMAPIEHAFPYRLDRDDAERAAAFLEEWSVAPRFRDPDPPAWEQTWRGSHPTTVERIAAARAYARGD